MCMTEESIERFRSVDFWMGPFVRLLFGVGTLAGLYILARTAPKDPSIMFDEYNSRANEKAANVFYDTTLSGLEVRCIADTDAWIERGALNLLLQDLDVEEVTPTSYAVTTKTGTIQSVQMWDDSLFRLVHGDNDFCVLKP